MSCRAGSSEFAFPASWLTGAGDNFCPSVSSCWRAARSKARRRLEAVRQSRPQLGFALAVAAPWWLSRNSPLNRSARDLLTGSLSLTVRSQHSVSNRQPASACAFHVCPCRWEPAPFGEKRVPFKLPGPLLTPFRTQDNQRYTHTRRKQKPPNRLNPHRCRARRKRQRPRSNAPIESAPAPNLSALLGLHAPGHFRLSHSVSGDRPGWGCVARLEEILTREYHKRSEIERQHSDLLRDMVPKMVSLRNARHRITHADNNKSWIVQDIGPSRS